MRVFMLSTIIGFCDDNSMRNQLFLRRKFPVGIDSRPVSDIHGYRQIPNATRSLGVCYPSKAQGQGPYRPAPVRLTGFVSTPEFI